MAFTMRAHLLVEEGENRAGVGVKCSDAQSIPVLLSYVNPCQSMF
jgi:hypothetical protein